MRKLSFYEYKTAQLQAELFELSISKAAFSSPMFIRRFMSNDIAKQFTDLSYLIGGRSNESIIEELNVKYKPTTKSPLYTKNEMYWIGYIYAALCFLYSINPKSVYKLLPPKKIRSYYNIYHTFDIEQAAERMMENIGWKNDLNTKAYLLLKKLIIREKLETLLGKQIKVIVDRPIGSSHPEHSEIIYPVNYGYYSKIKAADGEYQDVYILNENKPLNEYVGKVVAVIERQKDIEDKLVISNRAVNREEIEQTLRFIEKYHPHKVIQ